MQIRHQLGLKDEETGKTVWRSSVAAARSPFWNIRATDTVIEKHGGFVNYPLWCVINQLFLDPV